MTTSRQLLATLLTAAQGSCTRSTRYITTCGHTEGGGGETLVCVWEGGGGGRGEAQALRRKPTGWEHSKRHQIGSTGGWVLSLRVW
jgi:hypothetical protein